MKLTKDKFKNMICEVLEEEAFRMVPGTGEEGVSGLEDPLMTMADEEDLEAQEQAWRDQQYAIEKEKRQAYWDRLDAEQEGEEEGEDIDDLVIHGTGKPSRTFKALAIGGPGHYDTGVEIPAGFNVMENNKTIITMPALKQIVQEEFQAVLSEKKGLVPLLISKKAWIPAYDDKAIKSAPAEAWSELMYVVKSHWDGKAQLGLTDEEKAAMASKPVQKKLKRLNSNADRASAGRLPKTAITDISYFVPSNRTPDAARATGLGQEFLNVGLGGYGGSPEDVPL